jgi:hypothetical protein
MHRADHSSRGVLPIVVCLSVMVKPRSCEDPGPLEAVALLEKNKCPVFRKVRTNSLLYMISRSGRQSFELEEPTNS